ncbi:hypothetical protein PYCC9005_004488 [Savitreella phatthalungensis]
MAEPAAVVQSSVADKDAPVEVIVPGKEPLQWLRKITVISLVIVCYIYFRWLPSAHLPRIITALGLIWLSVSYRLYLPWFGSSPEDPIITSLRASEMWVVPFLLMLTFDATMVPWVFDDFRDLVICKLGHVGEDHARLTLRAPGMTVAELCYGNVKDLPESMVCKNLTLPGLDATDTDFVFQTSISDLEPDNSYLYSVRGWENVEEQSTASNETIASILGLQVFKTAPKRGESSQYTFLASSCILPGFPYNPIKRNRINGFESLYNVHLDNREAPSFMLFLGDFIYYDLPHFPELSLDNYYQKYRTIYASESFRQVYWHLPIVHTYDDHDVVNNYDSGEDTERYQVAHSAFEAYHGGSNPPAVRPGATYYTFSRGAVDYFLLDTRRYRSPNTAVDDAHKTMLGRQQLSDLLSWLGDYDGGNTKFKVIVSSVPFTRNWGGVDGHLDTWGGFLTERAIILEAVRKAGRDVICISGDRHEFAATLVGEPGTPNVLDLAIGPLNQFYLPFATYSGDKYPETDRKLSYIPSGNEKWGFFSVDTAASPPTIDFQLKVYGESVWNYTIVGQDA